MIIRSKLRPKELNEFQMYFGNLREIANPDLTKEREESIKEIAMYSKRTYKVKHKNAEKQRKLAALWEKVQQIFCTEMNETQKEIYEEQQLMSNMVLATLEKEQVIILKDANRDAAKVHTIDTILEAFTSRRFIQKIVMDVNSNIFLPIIKVDNFYDYGDVEISTDSDFSRIKLPASILEAVKDVTGKCEKKVLKQITYYIITILDALGKSWESTSLIFIVVTDALRELFFEVIMKELPKERVAFWKAATLNSSYFLDMFDNVLKKKLEQPVIELEPNCDAKSLVAENYYFNIAQGIIMNDANQIAIYFTVNKEERNIIINETVIMARKIKRILLEKVAEFDINLVYEMPQRYEHVLDNINVLLQFFRFTSPILGKEMEEKGVNKADWKFIENLFVLNMKQIEFFSAVENSNIPASSESELHHIVKTAIANFERQEEEKHRAFTAEVMKDIRKVNSKIELLSVLNKIDKAQEEEESITQEDYCETIYGEAKIQYEEQLRKSALSYSIKNLTTKNVDFAKAIKLLNAINGEYITLEKFVKIQQRMGVEEKYIRLFKFFYESDFI